MGLLGLVRVMRVRLGEKKKKLTLIKTTINPNDYRNNPNTIRDYIVFGVVSCGEQNAPLRISI